MGRFDRCFPFAAVAGQAQVKEALLLCAVHPSIGGVLISGEKGTAKSTLVRGLTSLLDRSCLVELPLNVTEDRLVGSIDPEATLRTGSPQFSPGILWQANGGILYADEVNLLPERIVNILLEVSESGVNHVQREGICVSHPCSFVLIGSMNPEEGPLRPAFLDRFGLYVEAQGERRGEVRCEIIRRRMEYEGDPSAFCARWGRETEALSAKVEAARALLKQVCLPESCIRSAARLSACGLCHGHRAELTLCRTGMALAAWKGRTQVTMEDMRQAAALALPHRLHEPLQLPEDPQEPEASSDSQSPWEEAPQEAPEGPAGKAGDHRTGNAPALSSDSEEAPQEIRPLTDPVTLNIMERKNLTALGGGKRLKVRNSTAKGRYVRYGFPGQTPGDIAVDATLRAAVLRESTACPSSAGPAQSLRIQVKKEDFREKIREQRTGAMILFVVDASGSMGARKRMGAVKGAVLAMLNDAYQKRDTVGMIAFRGSEAQVLLPFTRSVDLAQKCLKTLSTGGTTPLAQGLRKAGSLLKANLAKDKHAAQLMVLVSDGRANYARTDHPFEEALEVARELSALPIGSLVLDTEQGFARFGMAKKIADSLHGQYCPLDHISQQEITARIGSYLG